MVHGKVKTKPDWHDQAANRGGGSGKSVCKSFPHFNFLKNIFTLEV